MRVGFHLGGFAQFGLSEEFYLRPELLYSLEGSKSEREVLGETFTSTTNYNYLAIPVMARYSLGGLYFDGGPSIGFLLGGSTVTDDNSTELDMDNYNSMELALEFGGGYELENGLSFGLRADLGMTGLFDIEDDSDFSNWSNFGIRLSGAYAF
jgi:hypothetical protein